MSQQTELVAELTSEITKKLIDHAQTTEQDLSPEELLGQVIMPIVGSIIRVAGDILLADGKPRTQCRLQMKVNDKKIELSHGWTDEEEAIPETGPINIKEAVMMMRESIEQTINKCMDTLPRTHHRLGLALTSLEQVMAKLLLSTPEATIRDKLDAVTELTDSLQRTLLIGGHPNEQSGTRH